LASLAVAIVSKEGELLEKRRVRVKEPDRLDELLARYRPVEVVVETSSSWPWLRDRLEPQGIGFILAHAKRLRWIARSNYKSDEVDAELLARMHLAGLIPAVHVKEAEQREWGRLVRHRARLVRDRTAWVNRIHAQLHQVGLSIPRGRLLTRAGVQWLRTEAGPKLSQEQRRLIRTHLRLIQGVKPMIRGLDRRIEQVSGEVPAAGLVRVPEHVVAVDRRLAGRGVEWIAVAAESQPGPVKRQVHVLGEPLDQPVGLRQTGAALEHHWQIKGVSDLRHTA
jgi:transposase